MDAPSHPQTSHQLPMAVQLALVAAVALLVWYLSTLLLLVFGAVLVATILETLTRAITRTTGMRHSIALALVVVVILGALAGFGVLLGAETATELRQLVQRLPDLMTGLAEQLGISNFEDWAAEQAQRLVDTSLLSNISGTSAAVAYQLVNVLLILVAGIYLAARPKAYRDGLVKLVPHAWRRELDSTLSAIARALRYWLLGQLLSMLCVGVLTTIGLYLLGMPSVLALGVLAGLLEFVPYFGPIAAAVPAIAVGLTESLSMGIWVAGLYVLVQQAEWALIIPLIQRGTVHLPPALTIFSILAFGLLLGGWGVVLGAPLTVLCFVLVKKLWIRETLHEETVVPGEKRP